MVLSMSEGIRLWARKIPKLIMLLSRRGDVDAGFGLDVGGIVENVGAIEGT